MPYLNRLRHLAGLHESSLDDAEDEEIRQSDLRMEREQKIVQHIRRVFAMVGIAIDTERWAVGYEEDDDRTATVRLADEPEGYSIKLLAELYKTGLSDDYRITTLGGDMEIHFKVSPNLDDASLR